MIWLAVAVLFFCSAAVSASETALFCLGRQALVRFHGSSNPLERNIARLMENPRRCLLTILLANVGANVSIFTLWYVGLERLEATHSRLAVVASVAVLPIVIVFCDMLPKGIAQANAERLAPYSAMLVGVLEVILAPARGFLGRIIVDPLVRLLSPAQGPSEEVTDTELQALLEQSARDGVIDSKENEMLVGAVALGSTKVREVMTPRVDLQFLPASADPASARKFARNSRRRALLACGRDLDDIVGTVHVRDIFLNPSAPLTKLTRPVHYVPEQVNLVQLLRHFRLKKIQSAVVVDEYGGTAGVVSLVDITKRIVGEVSGRGAARPLMVEPLDEDTYRLPGDLSVRIWAGRFGIREIDGHIDTVAGLVLSRLGRLPKPGDSIRMRNLTLAVERMDRHRIISVLLHRDGPGGASA